MLTSPFAYAQPPHHAPTPYLQTVDTSWYQHEPYPAHPYYAVGNSTVHPAWQNQVHTYVSPYSTYGAYPQNYLHTDPYRGQALLRQAENEVPLAQIDLLAQKQFLNFQGRNLSEERKYDDRSEARFLGFTERGDIRHLAAGERSEVRQYRFLDNRQERQLVFDERSQKRELEFLNKTQERNFLGTLLTQLVPPVLNTIQNNSNGNREERMFDKLLRFKGLELKAQHKESSTSDSDEKENRALRRRIARLKRQLEKYKDRYETSSSSSRRKSKDHDVVIDSTPSRKW